MLVGSLSSGEQRLYRQAYIHRYLTPPTSLSTSLSTSLFFKYIGLLVDVVSYYPNLIPAL
jgi:hypothetical protein